MLSAYETYNNQIGVRLSFVLSDVDRRNESSIAVLSYSAYEKRARRNEGFRLRPGKGLGNEVLLNWDYLPTEWQHLCIEKFGDPKSAVPNLIEQYYVRDQQASDYYANYERPDGRNLKAEYIKEYTTNASVLNAIIKVQALVKSNRKKLGGSTGYTWEIVLENVEKFQAKSGHTLKSPSLRRTLANYKRDGYKTLISGKFGNDNSRKVNALVESMLLSLYSMENKPFAVSVHELYKLFLAGKFDVVDKQTGEFFNRADFTRNGESIEISEATVWAYINNPLNRALVDKSRLDSLDYNNTHRPHARRHAPNYSFSKVSMDDRDLPRKLIGGGRVKAYYAYDVTSGAVVGKAYSRNKDEALFIDCLRDMFRLMDAQKWGVPMEVEVENHLVNKFFDDLEAMFPILRICAPGNSQEKHAEHFNKAKKYGAEKGKQSGIGRWWAKSEAYRTKSNKVNDEYTETNYQYDRLMADDLAAIVAYNNELHPKQKKYPGMSRWQVLCYNINPELRQPNRSAWLKCIGNHTQTSIKRSKYLTVKYNEYELPSPAMISRLKPNNYTVDAYWLPNEFGEITEVYIYQHGDYICKCEKSATFNTAKAEWTDTDSITYEAQSAYTAQYDKMIKDGRAGKLFKPELIPIETIAAVNKSKVEIVPAALEPSAEFNLDEAMQQYNGEWYSERAINDL
ncbi:hypothetical protein [Solitalea koreensis]|uniref:Integrase catalytic domain-containing protein n=1 Tax=Solitalea koreensis TaxID=543615 RepID=A0A521BMT7_9SPHI|nr:hypothetical protein [Solitalea koreensis]SMO48443.1 hypothetical protein SAMN06265350_102349 [Solitalea koreensis]